MSRLAMSEAQLLQAVLDLAQLKQIKTAHFPAVETKSGRWLTPVRGDAKGWLDLFLLGAGGALFRELKTETNSLEPEQRQWMADLRTAGYDADVWKPRDLHSGRIAAELDAIRRPAHKLTGAHHG